MPTRETESAGLGGTAKQVAEHASTLARLEVELAGLELKSKIAALGVGAGLAVAAGIIAVFAVGFGLAAGAAGLAIVLDAWLALLIVFAGLLVLSGVLALIGVKMLKRGTPPVPKQAIEEAKRTQQVLRDGAH